MKPPTGVPCKECPWRLNSLNGWLGPYDADVWLQLAHSDEVIACHLTIEEESREEMMTQCTGAAIYRRNVAKSPRNRDIVQLPADSSIIFDSPVKFREHHGRKPRVQEDPRSS